MNAQRFTIEGKLPGTNEYQDACRRGPIAGAKMKKDSTNIVAWAAKAAKLERVDCPVEIAFMWVEGKNGNKKIRDVDNIRHGAKFVLDGLVLAGVLPDDNPYWVRRIYDNFRFNAKDPHIDVLIQPYVNAPRRVLYEPVRGLED